MDAMAPIQTNGSCVHVLTKRGRSGPQGSTKRRHVFTPSTRPRAGGRSGRYCRLGGGDFGASATFFPQVAVPTRAHINQLCVPVRYPAMEIPVYMEQQ